MYLGKGIEDAGKIKEKINKGKYVDDIFCICVSENGNNLMEIINSKEIGKKIYSNKKYIVIGLAKGKKESFKLVEDIIREYWLNGNLSSFKESCLSKAGEDGTLRWALQE